MSTAADQAPAPEQVSTAAEQVPAAGPGSPTAGQVPSRGWSGAGAGRTVGVGTGSARRAAIGSTPGTERGRRMRAQLLVAARVVFERDGYLNARVADIAAEAGASHGSFYTYFESKTEIFRAVVSEEMAALYRNLGSSRAAGAPPVADDRTVEDVVDGIEEANRRFVDMYQRNVALLALFEQVTTLDDEIRVLRLRVRRWMVDRVTASIRGLQADGHVEPSLDAHYASSALVAMVNGLVHQWMVVGEPFEAEPLVRTLTWLWAASLGLPISVDRWPPLPG